MAGENGDLTDELSNQAIIKFCVIQSDIMPAAEEYFIGELSCGTAALAICDSGNDLTQISFTPKLRIVS